MVIDTPKKSRRSKIEYETYFYGRTRVFFIYNSYKLRYTILR